MIGLDTNVLVRYFTQDHPGQSAAAARLIEGFTPEAPGFVPTVTLIETVWVLSRTYALSRDRIAFIVESLLRASELVVEDAETHYSALNAFLTTTVDYADAVISQAAKRAGCDYTATFDRRAAASGAMRLLDPA